MGRFLLLPFIGLLLGGTAFAQTTPPSQPAASASQAEAGMKETATPSLNGKVTANPSGAGTAKINKNDNSAIGANVPTIPEIALHPTASIGSGTPLAGPGGTTKTPQ